MVAKRDYLAAIRWDLIRKRLGGIRPTGKSMSTSCECVNAGLTHSRLIARRDLPLAPYGVLTTFCSAALILTIPTSTSSGWTVNVKSPLRPSSGIGTGVPGNASRGAGSRVLLFFFP